MWGVRCGKLRWRARRPRSARDATSNAHAAISAVPNDPSHTRSRLHGSRISDTHRPHERRRTPVSRGCGQAGTGPPAVPLPSSRREDFEGSFPLVFTFMFLKTHQASFLLFFHYHYHYYS